MKLNRLTFASLIIASASLVACDKEEGDVTKPEILLVSPAEGDTLYAGSEHGVHFDMKLCDNVALGSYKVDIHNRFDGHDHEVKSAEDHEHDHEPFEFKKTWSDIDGLRNATVHHHEIVIPENATPGEYCFTVYCVDQAGNQSMVVKHINIAEPDGDHDHEH